MLLVDVREYLNDVKVSIVLLLCQKGTLLLLSSHSWGITSLVVVILWDKLVLSIRFRGLSHIQHYIIFTLLNWKFAITQVFPWDTLRLTYCFFFRNIIHWSLNTFHSTWFRGRLCTESLDLIFFFFFVCVCVCVCVMDHYECSTVNSFSFILMLLLLQNPAMFKMFSYAGQVWEVIMMTFISQILKRAVIKRNS